MLVRDRDYMPDDPPMDYPIGRYMGYSQQLPIDRVRQHGARSAHHIVAIRPGTMDDEDEIKLSGTCLRCGQSLWYFASPRPPDELVGTPAARQKTTSERAVTGPGERAPFLRQT